MLRFIFVSFSETYKKRRTAIPFPGLWLFGALFTFTALYDSYFPVQRIHINKRPALRTADLGSAFEVHQETVA